MKSLLLRKTTKIQDREKTTEERARERFFLSFSLTFKFFVLMWTVREIERGRVANREGEGCSLLPLRCCVYWKNRENDLHFNVLNDLMKKDTHIDCSPDGHRIDPVN